MIVTIPVFCVLLILFIFAVFCTIERDESPFVALSILGLMVLLTIIPMPDNKPKVYEARVLSKDTVFCKEFNRTFYVKSIVLDETKTVKITIDTWTNWYTSGPIAP